MTSRDESEGAVEVLGWLYHLDLGCLLFAHHAFGLRSVESSTKGCRSSLTGSASALNSV